MASERLAFPVPFIPLPILVRLVTRHYHDAARAPGETNGLENVGGAQYICFNGLQRGSVTFSDDRLGRKVENEVRSHPLDFLPE